MNQLIARKLVLGANYAPLTSTSVIASGTLTAPITNADTAYIQGDLGDDIPLQPGEWHVLVHVDLSRIKAKGTSNDLITFVGGTW